MEWYDTGRSPPFGTRLSVYMIKSWTGMNIPGAR